jgi:hypothetical protein
VIRRDLRRFTRERTHSQRIRCNASNSIPSVFRTRPKLLTRCVGLGRYHARTALLTACVASRNQRVFRIGPKLGRVRALHDAR